MMNDSPGNLIVAWTGAQALIQKWPLTELRLIETPNGCSSALTSSDTTNAELQINQAWKCLSNRKKTNLGPSVNSALFHHFDLFRLKSWLEWVNQSMRVCRYSWECAATAVSSVNSISWIMSGLTFGLTFSWVRLNRLQSVVVCRYRPPQLMVLKACHRRKEKNILN